LVSIEGIGVMDVTLPEIDDDSLVHCSIQGVSYNTATSSWVMEGVQVLGYASFAKTLPDTYYIELMMIRRLSKIVFQHMARYHPLTVDLIVNRLTNT